MSGSGDFDFLQQIPLPILIAPVVFGVLYIFAMTLVFRRAAKRRRRARAERMGLPYSPPSKPSGLRPPHVAPSPIPAQPRETKRGGGMLNALRAALPSPGEMLAPLPEPDLDLLLGVGTPIPPLHTDSEGHREETFIEAEILATPPPPASVPAISQERTIPMPAEPTMSDLGDSVEVMRLWRDLNDGSLIIQMGGTHYRAAGEIRNPDLQRRFNTILRELLAMSEGFPPSPSIGGGGRPALEMPDASSGLPGSMKTRTATYEAAESKPKRSVFGRRGTTAEPESPAGIAEAVEEFLQFKLLAHPEFAVRSIHIRPSHDQGVIIEVDGHYYESIGDIVDPDVREFLAAMMREWEARH